MIKTFLRLILFLLLNLTALFLVPLIFITKLIVILIFGTFNWIMSEETWIYCFRDLAYFFELYSTPWNESERERFIRFCKEQT